MDETIFYTPKEVADKLRLHRNTVIKLILSRQLSTTIFGKQYRISQQQLQDYYDRNTIQQA